MRIGLDFDNTIVCYDELFHALALERGLIPPALPPTKSSVRDHLRSVGREEDWTRLQAIAYGSRILDARLFEGVADFLAWCRAERVPACIISHKTRYPILGERVDLHDAAKRCLQAKGLVGCEASPVMRDDVYFEPTKEKKLDRIRAWGCTHFVDDLPEFLLEPRFPGGVSRILFDPMWSRREAAELTHLRSWNDLAAMLTLKEAAA